MDVMTSFLHKDLEEEIYMKQPEGFVVKGKKELDIKPVKVPLPVGVKLSVKQCPKTQEEEEDMSRVPYAIAVSSLMYLRGTSDYGLCYQGISGLDRALDICGFVDGDWAGDLDQRSSISGHVFNLFGGGVSWMSKKQLVVELSTTEAEYMAATHASKEATWLQRLCSIMGLVQGAIRIDCDNQSSFFLARNPAYHSKTKHIDVQYHFVRDMIEDKKVLLVKVDTLKNTAMHLKKIYSLRSSLGVEKKWALQGWIND
eukprot:PITA_06244